MLTLASTFPAHEEAEVPSFVRDLIVATKTQHPAVRFAVLAPQLRGALPAHRQHAAFDEFRYRYAVPRSLEQLTEHGILPTLRQRPWLWPVVPLLGLGLRRALRRLIADWRPDVIHAHWFTPQGIIAVQEGRRRGIPVVITSHASDVRIWRAIPAIGRRIVRRYLSAATAITAVSERTLGFAASFFDADEWAAIGRRAWVIPMGVSGREEVVSPVRMTGGAKRVLFLGRLAEKKGVPDLIVAMRALGDADVRLRVAGDGPMRAELEALVGRSGLRGQVEFLGHVTGAAKRRILADADVLVIPSIETRSGDIEGLPVVLLEGLAAGIPCVATAASGAGEIIEHGRSGWLVPSRAPEALATAIREVLALEPDRRARVVEAGSAIASTYDWTRVAARHWDVLTYAVRA